MDSEVLAFNSLERLLHNQGYIICQESGQKIISAMDLAIVRLSGRTGQVLTLPVHKEYAHKLLQTFLHSFSQGLPAVDNQDNLSFVEKEI